MPLIILLSAVQYQGILETLVLASKQHSFYNAFIVKQTKWQKRMHTDGRH